MQKSESIKNIAKALAQFQEEVKNPANTADNPFYKSKYAPLSDVLNGSRPILSKYGLSVLQSPSCAGDAGNSVTLTTLIMHESGEWIESDPLTLKMDKPTAQGAGSAITYARRYALSAMLGVSSEDDDDGNHASGTSGKQEAKEPAATQKQLSKLFVVAKDVGMTSEQMKVLIQEKYHKDSSKKLTAKEASELIKLLEKETA
jgi:hypothetical protein